MMVNSVDEVAKNKRSSFQSRSVAIVSGKGGSGKTMIVATIANILDYHDIPTLLIDTDVGTGGLSYYLSIKYARGIGLGISELLLARASNAVFENVPPQHVSSAPPPIESNFLESVHTTNEPALAARVIRPLRGFEKVGFVSVGDLRKLQTQKPNDQFSRGLSP
jgi:hypothetical protein